MLQSGGDDMQSRLSQRLTRQKMRVAGIGMLVLVSGLGLGALAAWMHFYWLAVASVFAGMGVARIIAIWNI